MQLTHRLKEYYNFEILYLRGKVLLKDFFMLRVNIILL